MIQTAALLRPWGSPQYKAPESKGILLLIRQQQSHKKVPALLKPKQ
jgi:hypothetical protein